jgi:hypothetical protein
MSTHLKETATLILNRVELSSVHNIKKNYSYNVQIMKNTSYWDIVSCMIDLLYLNLPKTLKKSEDYKKLQKEVSFQYKNRVKLSQYTYVNNNSTEKQLNLSKKLTIC